MLTRRQATLRRSKMFLGLQQVWNAKALSQVKILQAAMSAENNQLIRANYPSKTCLPKTISLSEQTIHQRHACRLASITFMNQTPGDHDSSLDLDSSALYRLKTFC